ncbi:CPBP family intramembrane glutamic endopeptidase [Natronobacterium texcoconense]|uniref:CAAX prenyl protease 2/Lysostaphin resistance protein A-like domain-containing protein n=1 Tax=Natronobacterium texcoconense TaxID=1095778 RepID=A0A1H1AWA4_NATTX|nr:CPBP family intramembrane glutamic endopeptidase [Natronobacterium texcoconense]SDQ43950.1 hypothetical protein SAMN04489842_0833 [Natronobacterium texcoconense]
MHEPTVDDDSRGGIVDRVLYGGDTRLRATWRVLVPLVVAITVYVLGLLAVQQFVGAGGEPSPNGAVDVQEGIAGSVAIIVVIGVATTAALLVASRLDRRPITRYGLEFSRAWWRDFGGGVAIGLVASGSMIAFSVGAGQMTAEVELTGVGVDSAAVTAVVLAVLVGFVLANNVLEEVLFRGIVITNAAEGLRERSFGVVPAVGAAVAVSLPLFGLFHVLGGGAALVITSAIAGIYFAAGYVLTGQLALPIGVHFGGIVTYSVQQATLLGGLTLPSIVVVETATDPSMLTAFGSQFARVVVGVALIAVWVYVVYGQVSIDDGVYGRAESDA